MAKIYVTMEGGLISAVSSGDSRLVGMQVVLIDYDTEGAEPESVFSVKQDDGSYSEACVSGTQVDALGVSVDYDKNPFHHESPEGRAWERENNAA